MDDECVSKWDKYFHWKTNKQIRLEKKGKKQERNWYETFYLLWVASFCLEFCCIWSVVALGRMVAYREQGPSCLSSFRWNNAVLCSLSLLAIERPASWLQRGHFLSAYGSDLIRTPVGTMTKFMNAYRCFPKCLSWNRAKIPKQVRSAISMVTNKNIYLKSFFHYGTK